MPGRPFFWAELTSNNFKSLDPERTIGILPVAATEQHGPHLPVMTDTAIADGMIALLRERLPEDLDVLVLPVQSIGKSNEHLLSPGTLSLTADTLLRVLVEVGECVHRAGLRKMVLANSHGGNVPVLATALDRARAAGVMTVLNLAPAPPDAAGLLAAGTDWLIVNAPEAGAILGRPVADPAGARAAARSP